MDDPTESKILQDAIAVHIRIFLKFTSKALSSEKVNQNYSKYSVFLSAEFIFAILAFFILVFFRKQMQTLHDIFAHFRSACYLTRIEAVGLAITTDATSLEGSSTNEVWEAKGKKSACFALRGRRPKMEDRFTMIDSISDTEDIGIYAIYDGHGGEFAAEFIQKRMVERIRKKIEAVRKHIATSCFCSKEPLIGLDNQRSCETNKDKVQQPSSEGNIKDSEKKIENAKKGQVNKLNKSPLDKKDEWDLELLEKSCGLKRYISGSQVSLAQIIQDEIMALDLALLEVAKKSNNIAGTTLLFALHDRRHRKLVVANVGDSRGIMCDLKGKVIPLSFDHKPQQLKEHKRIKEAGGFISFNGVWRVAGILATSRALGDYPLKDRNLVTADPDILTFDLIDHQPKFIMLASDGLWDAFSNEEAASYINSKLDEPLKGAKSIAHQCLSRGSLDNVTVLVVDFR